MIIAVKSTFYTGVYRFGVFSCKKNKMIQKKICFALLVLWKRDKMTPKEGWLYKTDEIK